MRLWVQAMERDSNAVEITGWQGLTVELRYADTINITGKNIYCSEKRAWAHRDIAYKLQKAIALVQKEHPGNKLHLWDAARPLFAQAVLREAIRGKGLSDYVSSATKGSLHNFGMALDLTAENPDGTLLDMGTDFDSFSPAAGASRRMEDSLVVAGELTARQVANRRIMRSILQRAGLIQLPSEWWHFNGARSAWVYENMQMLGVR